MYKAAVLTSHLEHRPHPDPEPISCCCWDKSDRKQPDFLPPGVWLWTVYTSSGDIHPPPCNADKSSLSTAETRVRLPIMQSGCYIACNWVKLTCKREQPAWLCFEQLFNSTHPPTLMNDSNVYLCEIVSDMLNCCWQTRPFANVSRM